MPANRSVSPDSVEIYNLDGVTLHVVNFITNTICALGGRAIYSSSLPAIVGYWFNATDTPSTASLTAVDVSLISTATGQFRFTTKEGDRAGKLCILSLT